MTTDCDGYDYDSREQEARYYDSLDEPNGTDDDRLVALACYVCKGDPMRRIVSEGVTGGSFDPTATYTLACGHTII